MPKFTPGQKAAALAEARAETSAADLLAGARGGNSEMITVNREQLIAALSLVPVGDDTAEPASPAEESNADGNAAG
jgi:hypothetical protein